jgi:hypothetical protein
VLGAWAAVPALVRSSFLPSPPPPFCFLVVVAADLGEFPQAAAN